MACRSNDDERVSDRRGVHVGDDGLQYIDKSLGFSSTLTHLNVVGRNELASIDAGRFPRGQQDHEGMRFSGFYSESGEAGILFAVAVPSCGMSQAIRFASSRWRLGFLRHRSLVWFAVVIDGIGFDAPFGMMLGDIDAECVRSACRDLTLKRVKVCFVDGHAVRARRDAVLDAGWVRALGRELCSLPEITSAEQRDDAIQDGMTRYTTRQIIEAANMRAFVSGH